MAKDRKMHHGTAANVGYEAELWRMADALRGSMDAAEYKHVVLGLIFLKYISDAFEAQHATLEAEEDQGADPEDPDEYRALNIFWVRPEARWSHLKAHYVITPAADTERLHHGRLVSEPSYVFAAEDDGCPYRHRRRVEWAAGTLKRTDLSVPFQNTIRSSLTVFAVSQRDEFLSAIGRKDLVAAPVATSYDPYRVVLEQVLQLDDKEFEILVGHLLTVLGFEGSEVTGKTGDGGVDAIGELNVANLAKVKVFVQAKRYKLGTKVSANTVRQLRQAIPFGGQGAFITTVEFQGAATDVALEPGFPRIGLINGRQLVDLLIEHWGDIPHEFQERLGLKPGLVRA